MTEVIANPNKETGSVSLDIYKTADILKVVRTNVNGSEEVRVSEGQLPSPSSIAVVRTNYVTNPSFENNTTGYTAGAGVLTRVTTGGAAVGANFMRLTTNVAEPSGTTIHTSYTVTLTGGKTYISSFLVRSSLATTWNPWQWINIGAAETELAKTAVGALSPHVDWTRIAMKFTVPGTGPTVVKIQPGIYQVYGSEPDVPVGTTIDFDGFLVEEATDEATAAGTYFDGDTADIPGFDYSWTGAAHGSTSTLQTIGGRLILEDYEAAHGLNSYNVYVGPETRTNRHTNPVPGSTNLFTTSGGTGTWVHDTGEGEPFTRFTKNSAAAITTAFNTHSAVTIPAASTVSMRAWVRVSYATNVSVRNDGTAIAGTSTAVAANTWTEIIVNGYAIAGSTFRLTFLISGFQPNATFDVKQMLWETSPTVGDYFSGSTPNTADVVTAWTGTADASSSTQTTSNGVVTGSATLDIDKPWLSVPVMPQYSEQVDTITQFGSSREASTTVHRPLGRADSLVVMGKLGDRTGSLEVFCNTYADARKLERIFERGEIVQLRQRVEGMDMYFTATSIPVSPYSVVGEDTTKWAMVINYVEVRRPIGLLAGALGWTFEELAASAASFNVITESYTTFDALTLGDANV